MNWQPPAAGVSPETELLLNCSANVRMSGERTSRIKELLRQELDWDYLIQLTLRHELMPLLYWQLHTISPGTVPQAYLSQLRNVFQANAAHNLFLTTELCKVFNLYQSQGIPALAYKGPALAVSAYGDLKLRQFGDLDLLIRKEDVPKAVELLIAEGYTSKLPLADVRAADRVQEDYHDMFVHPDRQIMLEIHWGFSPPGQSFKFEFDQLLERAAPVTLNRKPILTLSAEDLLVILCVHASKHFGDCEKLKWMCDIAALIDAQQEQLDWEKVISRAGESKSLRRLFLNLLLVNDLLGTSLPPEILRQARSDRTAKILIKRMRKQLFENPPVIYGPMAKHFFNLLMKDSWQDQMRYALPFMTPNATDLTHTPLPGYLHFLHYLIRPIRLAKRYSSDFFKRFIR